MRLKLIRSAIVLLLIQPWIALGPADAANTEPIARSEIAAGPFQPTMESLGQYRCPEWFRDAKLGIWAVWGPESVPEQGDWYAHRMYDPKDPAYTYHLAHYGHPSKFGFKDIIPLWKAEHWDPDHLMSLYKKAGAKYFCMIAEHHDNFDCWNSKYQPWNSVNMGPQRDIAGEWQKAAKKQGLRFSMTEHLAASWWFYSLAKGADKTGPLAGIPYDGADPRYADLYWTGNEQPTENYYCPHGPARIKQAWFDRIQDMIDRYHPDLLYSDSPLPYPDEFGRRLLAHYYNQSAGQHAGRVEAVYNCKQDSQGRWVQDLERGVMDTICPAPWQTDTCVGGWYYDVNRAKGHGYKSVATVIQMLCDIVSKNGNLLLNFPPRPDGTLDDDELRILDGMAAWMTINGEAIYGTRPWKIFGETSRKLQGGMFNEGALRYTAKDIRFTSKGETLYAIALGWPEDRRLTVRSLAAAAGKVTGVTLLGHAGDLPWSQSADGLIVTLPEKKPCEHAFALKIVGDNLLPAPLKKDESGKEKLNAPPAESITVRPARDNAMLINPGKGWVQYYGADKYTKDYISIGYTRWAWSVLEPKEGEFHWKEIDGFVQQFKRYGKKSAFGVMNVSTGLGQYVTPKWVFEAGAVPLAVPDNSSPTGRQIIPKTWDDPVFLAKMKAFVQALGRRYDGNPDIAFLDVRSYGNWGEGHIGMLDAPGIILTPPENLKNNYFSPYMKAFPHTQLIIPWGSDTYNSVYDWAVAQGAGMRRDGILSKWSRDGSECLRAHGRHPSVFEYCDGYAEMKQSGWWKPEMLKSTYFNGGKPSYMQWNPNIFEENRDFCLSLGNYVGYHFVLEKAILPTSFRPAVATQVQFEWRNDGVAYLYEPCQIAIALLDQKDQVVQKQWLAGSNPRSWKPDERTTETVRVTFSAVPPGAYKLAVGLFLDPKDAKPVYRLGIQGRTAEGWYILNDKTRADP